jgi:hypothetical protein
MFVSPVVIFPKRSAPMRGSGRRVAYQATNDSEQLVAVEIRLRRRSPELNPLVEQAPARQLPCFRCRIAGCERRGGDVRFHDHLLSAASPGKCFSMTTESITRQNSRKIKSNNL